MVVMEEDSPQVDLHEALSQIETLVGSAAATVISAPEYNLSKLRDLLACLNRTQLGPFSAEQHRKTVLALHRLIAKSATKVFEDIIPNYRIKQSGEASEDGKKLSRDVARLRQYERTFSSIYKSNFIDFLKRMLDCLKKNPSSTFYTQLIKTDQEDRENLAQTAVECYGRILAAHPHFNFRDQLISILVEQNAQTKHIKCAEIAHQYLSKALREDKLGEVSLEVTSCISDLTRKRKLSVSSLLFKSLLELRLIDVKTADADEKAQKKAEREKLASMKKKQSRKERKRDKKLKKFKNELLEAEAHNTTSQKLKYHRVILKRLFVTYFRLLRYHEDLLGEPRETKKFVKLLPPVLEGVAKFSNQIDITLCNDMFPLIDRLLKNSDIPNNCKLHCLSTVFVLYRSLESELSRVDPENFYKHFYAILTNLSGSSVTEQEFLSLINCIQLLLIKRAKLVNSKRYCAFARRLLILALNLPSQYVNQLLESVRQMLLQKPNTCAILDSSNCSNFGSGQCDMEIEDPDYAHADASVAWEVHMLRNHFDQSMREAARKCFSDLQQ